MYSKFQISMWAGMVQYNKLNPTWKETFVFPLDVSLSFIQSGNPVVLHLNVFDHDVVGDHDLIGEAQFDLTQLCIDALGNGVTQPVSANKVLTPFHFAEPVNGGCSA